MKTIPILFSTPMVKAIDAKTKTQTRRIASFCKDIEDPEFLEEITLRELRLYEDQTFRAVFDTDDEPFSEISRYGKAGDVLWVRETWFKNNLPTGWPYDYKAEILKTNFDICEKWQPSIFMPRDAARYFLQVESLKMERVADISEQDAIAEGINELLQSGAQLAINGSLFRDYSKKVELFNEGLKAQKSYQTLWDSINNKPKPIQRKVNGKTETIRYVVYPFNEESAEKYAWKTTWRGKPLTVITNPWVWVLTFKEVERPENFLKPDLK